MVLLRKIIPQRTPYKLPLCVILSESMKRIISIVVMFSIVPVPLYYWWFDVQNDRENNLVIAVESDLFELPPQDYPIENRVIGKVNSLSKVVVLRMGYGKDFRAWKVKTETEMEGWLIEDGENVKVIKK